MGVLRAQKSSGLVIVGIRKSDSKHQDAGTYAAKHGLLVRSYAEPVTGSAPKVIEFRALSKYRSTLVPLLSSIILPPFRGDCHDSGKSQTRLLIILLLAKGRLHLKPLDLFSVTFSMIRTTQQLARSMTCSHYARWQVTGSREISVRPTDKLVGCRSAALQVEVSCLTCEPLTGRYELKCSDHTSLRKSINFRCIFVNHN